jgi:hypothetical protein
MRLKLPGVIVLKEAVVLWRLPALFIVQPWMRPAGRSARSLSAIR